MYRTSERRLSASLLHSLRHRLGEKELRRRLWHFFPGFLAMAAATVPHRETVRLWVMLLIVVCSVLLPAWMAIRHQRTYQRRQGENLAPSILGYVIPVSILALIFRSHIEIPLTVAAIISFGDGSATLAGLLLGQRKVPWNPKKSWIGMAAFLVIGSLLAATVYRLAAGPQVPFSQALFCVAPIVAACGLIESLPLKLNDNLTVGCSASALLIAMQFLLPG